MTSPEETFARVRELINGPKTHLNWESVRAELATSAARSKPFRERYDEAIRSALDSQWPDILRTVSFFERTTKRRWARTFRLSFEASDQRHFATTLGKSFTRTLTREFIKEMMPHWLPDPDEHYSGLIVAHLDTLHAHLLTTLLDTGKFNNLEALVFEEFGVLWTHSGTDSLSDAVDVVIDRCKDSLTLFGATTRGTNQNTFSSIWEPIVQRSSELTGLRWLHSDDIGDPSTDPLWAILYDSNYDNLDTLTFESELPEYRSAMLIERKASLNLRRIGAGGLDTSGAISAPQRLIDAPNLANVDTWDLRQESHRPIGEWDTEEVKRWADYTNGIRRDALAFAEVDLRRYDPTQRRDSILTPAGALRRSKTLRELSTGELSQSDLFVVIRGAIDAWPNIECLSTSTYSGHWETFVDEVTSSGLLERLRRFDVIATPKELTRQIQKHSERTDVMLESIRSHLDIIFGSEMHPFFAYKHWLAILETVNTKRSTTGLARSLGLSADLRSMNRLETMRACDDHVIERLGGRTAILRG